MKPALKITGLVLVAILLAERETIKAVGKAWLRDLRKGLG
jgi:hypothetical protein